MRVTNAMMTQTVTFNMQRSIQRFLKLQTQMSSGRRINKASDDPLGTMRDLSYRNELAQISQYRSNISQAQTYMLNYDSLLSDLKNKFEDAYVLATAMANDDASEESRVGSAEEIEGIFEGVMQLANSELEGKSIFSGYRTRSKALLASSGGVTYNGDSGLTQYTIESSQRVIVNLLGNEVFLDQITTLGEGGDLNPGINQATLGDLLANLNNGTGIDQVPGTFTITDENLGVTANVDLSAATTFNDVLTTINAALAATVPPMSGSLNAVIGRENNNILFETTATGQVSDVTSLARLNGGVGIDLSDGEIRVSNGGAVDVVVDLSGTSTLGEVRAAFNAQMAAAGHADITMSINGAGDGLQIDDASGPRGVQISDISESSRTARDLHILGTVTTNLVGGPLNPTVSFKVEETGGNTATDLGIVGSFTGDFAGVDLDPAMTVDTRIADLNSGLGAIFGRIIITQGATTRTVDLGDPTITTIQDVLDAINGAGLDITASLNDSGRGIQVINDDPGQSLTILDEGDGTTTKELGIYGSSDMMGSLLVLAHAMRNNDRDGCERMIHNMQESMDHLLNTRATVGSRSIQLENTDNRLVDQNLSFTTLLSEVEDADMAEMVTKLAAYENSYQASLAAAARVIQPSLIEFLR